MTVSTRESNTKLAGRTTCREHENFTLDYCINMWSDTVHT